MGHKGSTNRRSPALSPKEIVMLKSCTGYTEEEIRDWHAKFIRDHSNGKLNKKQFVEEYKKFYRSGNANRFCELAFSMFDSNHDGAIDFDEFLLAIAATCQGDVDYRLEVAFDICDTSNDNQIDRKELARMISALYDLHGVTDRTGDNEPKKRAEKVISQLDVDGNRKLSKYEFIAGCKNDPQIRRLLVP